MESHDLRFRLIRLSAQQGILDPQSLIFGKLIENYAPDTTPSLVGLEESR